MWGVRQSWVWESIEKYVIWLSDQGYAARTVHRIVPRIRRFGEISWDFGDRNLNDLPAHAEPFIEIWMREHKRRSTKKRSRSSVCRDPSESLERYSAIRALQKAIMRRRPGAGLMIHCDRGAHYASSDFKAVLRGHKFIQSMSPGKRRLREGNCWDNAVAESYFHTIKTQLIHHCLPKLKL